MKIAERILLALKDSPKRIDEIGGSNRIISATVSNNPLLFLRLDRGVIGLVGRDEDLVKDWRKSLPLYKRICNLLVCGPMRLKKLYEELKDVKRVSIRADINNHPELFIRIKRGLIGRRGRDEHLIEKYSRAKEKVKRVKLVDLLELVLIDGPKSLDEISFLLRDYPRRSITCKLSLSDRFVRIRSSVWGLRE